MADMRNALPPLADMVRGWLREDVPSFDVGGAVVGDKVETAVLFCKSSGVLAGCPFFDAVFSELGCSVQWNFPEGSFLEATQKPAPPLAVATVVGKAKNVLLGERTALNLLSRASGIATRSHQLVTIKKTVGWHGVVAGTRKTTPGFRLVEKYAMIVGGADAHRVDLSSMVMLKDNHVWSRGSIKEAVKDARRLCGFSLKIDVECQTLADAEEALDAGADIVMLDNLDAVQFKAEAATLKKKYPNAIIEGSGGINDRSIASYMSPDVDVLSTSWIHQGVPHIDFSLKVPRN